MLVLNNLIKKVRDRTGRFAKEHREFHSSVSKIGKSVDKNFTGDYSCMERKGTWADPESKNLLNKVIVEHFLRKGMLDIVDELIREAQLNISEEEKKPFAEINHILEALKKHNIEPALEWVERNREQLNDRKSNLEFKLHRLQFIEYLSQGTSKQQELINYARTKLQPLAYRHKEEIQTLMGSLIYLKTGIQNSPYAHLFDSMNWTEICDTFIRNACSLIGMSVDSPLSIALDAGCIAFPALLNIRQVMQQRRVPNVWTAKDELPIVINLGKKYQFHSIFACPILRQQASENNPPMRLVCGHVISRDALSKMASGGSKVKCPYCPVEQNPQTARQIFF